MKNSKAYYQASIDKTKLELKDFQRLTVDFIFDKFYNQNRNKFLVADEVGLGKTIVAKGLIVKAFENFKPTKENPTFNVIYICSNQALAKENLKKLNFTKDSGVVKDPLNRLIYLAYKEKRDSTILRFDSLTPATSLNISQSSGAQSERAIIYSLLANFSPFKKRKLGLKWLLKGSVNIKNWNKTVDDYYNNRFKKLRPETFKRFRDKLRETKITATNMPRFYKYLKQRGGISFWDGMMGLSREINHNNHEQFKFKNEVIVYLRHLLTKVCLEYLSADLIILDEFQRYAEILGTNVDTNTTQAAELAKAVFELKGTKVLMLSATPFKPYTTSAEQEKGESHYNEFHQVLEFLMENQGASFWIDFENDRREFFSKIINPKETLAEIDSAIILKNRIQQTYSDVIVRTERHQVSDDRNLLVKSLFEKPLPISTADVSDFIVFDKLLQKIRLKGKFHIASPIEYSKSSPYPLSFLDGYQLKENLEGLKDDPEVRKYLNQFKSAWLSLDDINHYKILGKGKDISLVPNAKMQWLINQLNESDSWKWLWVPPTINYYKPRKIYPSYSDFTKTLVFSSWKMVPRAISTVLSYEAERKIMTTYRKLVKLNEPYFADKDERKKRKPTPILAFKIKSGGESSAMSLFTLIYPSKFLADLYDPQNNLSESFSIDQLIEKLSRQIEEKFNLLNLSRFVGKGGESERWFWAAPLLLDKFTNSHDIDIEDSIRSLLKNEILINNKSYGKGEEITGKNEKIHVDELIAAYQNPESIGLGTIPQELFQTLALMCLASPSICFLRSIMKSIDTDFKKVFIASYVIGISKMHFFNKPESIATIKSTLYEDTNSYWLSVLNYCLEGNLQSTLDEYIHLLVGSGNTLEEIRIFFTDVLSLHTSTIKVDDLKAFTTGISKKIRTHYAVDFGTQDLETDSGTGRVINVRQAFNSPYRPFVLASTSIGQEGLDFHYYCGRVMHWNLPGNAIDIEQREGRVNRYKGHIIRRNVADKYLKFYDNMCGMTVWDFIFDNARQTEGKDKNKSELVPYWHIEPVNGNTIQRIVPIYPFSRDIQKYHSLMETLTYYRLTFGQPRQEELVETLQQSGLTQDEIDTLRKNLLIDLSPKILTQIFEGDQFN
ncbi:MAG: hypothetical protein AB9834_00270 [Lentimicrobium sp.]